MERLLTTKQAAEALGIKPSQLQKQRAEGGGLPYYKLGGAVRYSPEHIGLYKVHPITRIRLRYPGQSDTGKERWYSEKELAQILQLSESTLQHWRLGEARRIEGRTRMAGSGRGPAHWINDETGKPEYREWGIEFWLESKRRNPKS